MDSSSSITEEDYDEFLAAVGESQSGNVQGPGGTNFGFVQFATRTNTVVQIYDGSTPDEWDVTHTFRPGTDLSVSPEGVPFVVFFVF